MIGLGSALGLAGTTLGILAAPLAILRAVLEPSVSLRLKVLVILVAVSGVITYRQVCRVGGVTVFHADPRLALPSVDFAGGAGYALSVPGRLLWPSLIGVPVSSMIGPMPAWFCIGAGALALAATAMLALWPRAWWNRRLVLVGAAMIYCSYALTYSARIAMLKRATGPSRNSSTSSPRGTMSCRYWVRSRLSPRPRRVAVLRRCDARQRAACLDRGPGRLGDDARTIGRGFSLELDAASARPARHPVGATPSRRIGNAEGVSRSQLMRIFDPVYRNWNGSIMNRPPAAFHLMNLAVQAPEEVAGRFPMARPVPDSWRG